MIEKPPINLTCSCAPQVVPFPELGSRSYALVMCVTLECGSHMVAEKKLFTFCCSEHLNNTLTSVSFIRVMRKFKGNYSFLPSIHAYFSRHVAIWSCCSDLKGPHMDFPR